MEADNRTTPAISPSEIITTPSTGPQGPVPAPCPQGGIHRPAPQPPQYRRGNREGGRSDRSALARRTRLLVRSKPCGQSAESSEALGRRERPPRWRGL